MNFITCHDGFTLNDLVSYQNKHNESNGENNCDGANDNRSWNCGVEGPTSDPEIERLRNRQVKNFFTATLLSVGTPMILMGDEVRRTQDGNNNNYSHGLWRYRQSEPKLSILLTSYLKDQRTVNRLAEVLALNPEPRVVWMQKNYRHDPSS